METPAARPSRRTRIMTARLRAVILMSLLIASSAFVPTVRGAEPSADAVAASAAPVPGPSEVPSPAPSATPSGPASSGPASSGPAFSGPAPAAPASAGPVSPGREPVVLSGATKTATSTLFGVLSAYVPRDSEVTVEVDVTPAPDSGTVTLKVDGVQVDVVDVTAFLIPNYLHWTPTSAGVHSLQAFYSGSATFAASSSSPLTENVYLPPPTSVTITSSANPVPRLTDVTLTATVLPNPGGGSIEWRQDNVVVATSPLDGDGKATYTTSFADTPYRVFTARFTGTTDWGEKTSDPFYQDVAGDAVAIVLTVPSNPMPAGPVVVTATLTPNPGDGLIRFTPSFGNEVIEPVDANGQAILDLGTLQPYVYPVTAEYLGDATYGHASTELDVNVWAQSTVSLTINRSSAIVGELPVIATATVTTPGADPGGSVFFLDDVGGVVVTLGPATVGPTGTAVLSTSSLRIGTHQITAHFVPPSGWMDSSAGPATVVVAADTAVHATFKVSLPTFYPYKDSYRDTVALGGVLDEKATVTIKVYSSTGSLKRTFSLGTRAAGSYSASWNGRTSTGTAVAAGKYKVVATIKDTHGHSKTFTSYTTVSWRKVVWKAVAVLRYASTGAYYAGAYGGDLYVSPDYPNGRILDSGSMIRDCETCGWIGGRFVFGMKSTALDYKSIYLQVRGHGFSDREHPGSVSVVNPTTKAYGSTSPNCEDDQPGVTCGLPISKSYVSSTKALDTWVWMTQAWGDAYDLYYVKLTYQYAIWAT